MQGDVFLEVFFLFFVTFITVASPDLSAILFPRCITLSIAEITIAVVLQARMKSELESF